MRLKGQIQLGNPASSADIIIISQMMQAGNHPIGWFLPTQSGGFCQCDRVGIRLSRQLLVGMFAVDNFLNQIQRQVIILVRRFKADTGILLCDLKQLLGQADFAV